MTWEENHSVKLTLIAKFGMFVDNAEENYLIINEQWRGAQQPAKSIWIDEDAVAEKYRDPLMMIIIRTSYLYDPSSG